MQAAMCIATNSVKKSSDKRTTKKLNFVLRSSLGRKGKKKKKGARIGGAGNESVEEAGSDAQCKQWRRVQIIRRKLNFVLPEKEGRDKEAAGIRAAGIEGLKDGGSNVHGNKLGE